MRHVTSLSLPARDSEAIKKQAKQRGFKSLSAYVKHLVELDKEIISEKELLRNVRETRKEYRAGKSIKADSISPMVFRRRGF